MDYFSPYTLSAILAIPTLLIVMGLFSRKDKFVVVGRTVLLTGASQGMGLSVAKKLASKGANLVLVARNKSKLEEALKEVTSAAKDPSKQRFTYISADASSLEQNERILAEATTWNDGRLPDIVWQIAGTSHPALFIDTSMEIQRQQMDINYWGAAYLAQATLKLWTEEKQAGPSKSAEPLPRHFVFTATTAIYVGVAGYATYSPAKAALRNLSDALRQEMQLYNGARYHNLPKGSAPSAPEIKVHLIAPGTILSPGHDTEELTKHQITRILEADDPEQTPDQVADAAIKGLENGNYQTTTQFIAHAMKASALGGSPRNGLFGIRDMAFSWIVSIVFLFVGPDMERKVYNFGKKHGVQRREVSSGKSKTGVS